MEVFGTQLTFPLPLQLIQEKEPKIIELAKVIVTKDGSIFDLSYGLTKKGVAITIGIVAGVVCLFYTAYKYRKDKNQPQEVEPQEVEPQQVVFMRPVLQRINEDELNSVSSISTISYQQDYEKLRCPITLQLMIEPVNLKCSHHFEKSAILQHFSKNDKKCPICRQPAQISDIRDSQFAKLMILKFRKKAIKMGKQWLQKRILADFDQEINPLDAKDP